MQVKIKLKKFTSVTVSTGLMDFFIPAQKMYDLVLIFLNFIKCISRFTKIYKLTTKIKKDYGKLSSSKQFALLFNQLPHFLGSFPILIPVKFIAKIPDPRRVKKMGPRESNAWKIPRAITPIKGKIKEKINIISSVVVSDWHEQVALEQAS